MHTAHNAHPHSNICALNQHPLDDTPNPSPPHPDPHPYPSVTQGWLAWHPVQVLQHTGRLLATQQCTSGQACFGYDMFKQRAA